MTTFLNLITFEFSTWVDYTKQQKQEDLLRFGNFEAFALLRNIEIQMDIFRDFYEAEVVTEPTLPQMHEG